MAYRAVRATAQGARQIVQLTGRLLQELKNKLSIEIGLLMRMRKGKEGKRQVKERISRKLFHQSRARSMPRLPAVIIVLAADLILFAVSAYALSVSELVSFVKGSSSAPSILNLSVYPQKVSPGWVLLILKSTDKYLNMK